MASNQLGPYVKVQDLARFKGKADGLYATKDEVSQAVSSAVSAAYVHRGSVAAYADLPSSGLKVGDVYNVVSAYGDYPPGTNWAWNGSAWDALGGPVDLSAYATKASPALTGTPTAPTAPVGTNTTQVATTGFVKAEIAAEAYVPPASGVIAGSYGDKSAKAPGFGGSFKALSAMVDAQGRVTEMAAHDVTVPSATASSGSDGLMSKSDKSKLDGIASGAQANVIESVKVNGAPLAVDSKAVNVPVPTKLTDLSNDGDFVRDASYVHTDSNYTADEKSKLAGIASGAQANVIEAVKVNGTAQSVSSKAVDVQVPVKLTDLQNDGNFVRDASYVHTDSNYTAEEKSKLASVSDTYLSKSDASSTYLTQSGASSTYLTQSAASSTYATKAELTEALALRPTTLDVDSWDDAARLVFSGNASTVFPIGSYRTSPLTYASTVYQARWNAVHNADVELESGAIVPGAYLQMHNCLPIDTQFSQYQAFLAAVTVIPAGTYNVTMGFSWGSNVVSGKTYQFTLTQDLPAGGQLEGFRGGPDVAPANWRVYAYASATAATATETCVVTEGSGGTSLGTLTLAGVPVPLSGTPETVTTVGDIQFYGLNAGRRAMYGNNRYAHSAIRQFLNSSGTDWWKPQHVFDRPPSYAGQKGFLSWLDPEMVAAMLPVKVVTALNFETDGATSSGTQADVTYDKVFLPSWSQHYLQPGTSYGVNSTLEGEPWDYWKAVAGRSTALAASTWGNTSTYHTEYVQYDIASPTSARSVWMRSANRNNGTYAAFVYSYGTCSSFYAVTGYRAAPTCVIGKSGDEETES